MSLIGGAGTFDATPPSSSESARSGLRLRLGWPLFSWTKLSVGPGPPEFTFFSQSFSKNDKPVESRCHLPNFSVQFLGIATCTYNFKNKLEK